MRSGRNCLFLQIFALLAAFLCVAVQTHGQAPGEFVPVPLPFEDEPADGGPCTDEDPRHRTPVGSLSTICQLTGPVFHSQTQRANVFLPHSGLDRTPPFGWPSGQPGEGNVTNFHDSYNAACDLNAEGVPKDPNQPFFDFRLTCPDRGAIVGTDLGIPAVVTARDGSRSLILAFGDTSPHEATPAADISNILTAVADRPFEQLDLDQCPRLVPNVQTVDGSTQLRPGIPPADLVAYMGPVLESSKESILAQCYHDRTAQEAEALFQQLEGSIRAIPIALIEKQTSSGTVLYAYYFASSVAGCGLSGLNLIGLAESRDGGATFRPVPGAFWGPSPDRKVDFPFLPDFPRGPRFLMAALVHQGHVYTYWLQAYRQFYLYVARVPLESIADPFRYEFLTAAGWKRPAAGKKFRADAQAIFGDPARGEISITELSIQYNAHVRGFIALYVGSLTNERLDEARYYTQQGFRFRVAPQPWGPFEPYHDFQLTQADRKQWKRQTANVPGGPYCFTQNFDNYGAFHHPALTRNGGKDLYFVTSSWGHYNTFLMKLELGHNLRSYFSRPVLFPAADFDGDGRTDLVAWRPATGRWRVDWDHDGAAERGIALGMPADVPVPADYDGNGKTDAAVFQPATGQWLLDLRPGRGPERQVRLGAEGDLPAPGDYNGDGKADLAVFRPAQRRWLVDFNLDGRPDKTVRFGQREDVPVPGDYNGDGKTDVAIYRPSSGLWLIDTNLDGRANRRVAFGLAGDRVVPADYDGDGATDVAVFRPLEGGWYIDTGLDGTVDLQVGFGIVDDVPAPGDYDGDGRAEPAVYRPAGGFWLADRNLDGQPDATLRFGTVNDVPL